MIPVLVEELKMRKVLRADFPNRPSDRSDVATLLMALKECVDRESGPPTPSVGRFIDSCHRDMNLNASPVPRSIGNMSDFLNRAQSALRNDRASPVKRKLFNRSR